MASATAHSSFYPTARRGGLSDAGGISTASSTAANIEQVFFPKNHIPSDLVVDRWGSDVVGSSGLHLHFFTMAGRLIHHKANSTISRS
jgi:hypothetical protein